MLSLFQSLSLSLFAKVFSENININHQDPVAKALKDFDLFSFLSPATAPREMQDYW